MRRFIPSIYWGCVKSLCCKIWLCPCHYFDCEEFTRFSTGLSVCLLGRRLEVSPVTNSVQNLNLTFYSQLKGRKAGADTSWIFNRTLSTFLAAVNHLCTKNHATAVTSQLFYLNPFLEQVSKTINVWVQKCLVNHHQFVSLALNVIERIYPQRDNVCHISEG